MICYAGLTSVLLDFSGALAVYRLLRTYRQDQSKLLGYLEDYAFLADGLIACGVPEIVGSCVLTTGRPLIGVVCALCTVRPNRSIR